MAQNPYESPRESDTARRNRRARNVIYTIAWCFFFLLPAITVTLSFPFPEIFGLTQRPDTRTFFGRVSLCILVRADVVLPISFVGCTLIGVLSPLSRGWKIALIVSWFPLMFFAQFVAIILAIQFATGYVCT